MSLHDDLSRLLSNELSREEESRLLERIASEPDVALVWEEIRALPAALKNLPAIPPPAALDRAILDRYRERRAPRTWPIPLLLAAAALLLALWPNARTQIELLEGSEIVEGRATVRSAGIEVDVDGRAKVSVEPDAAPARVMGAEVSDMKLIGGALAGALVTVTVYEGTASLRGTDPSPVDVAAGETKSLRGEAPPAPTERASTEAELRARVAELEGQLQTVQFEQALSKGQLQQHEGKPAEWPKDLPDKLHPEAFEASIKDIVAGLEGGELLEVDCTEYPCIALVEDHTGTEAWNESFETNVKSAFGAGPDPDDARISMWRSNIKNDVGEAHFNAVAIYPPGMDEGSADENTRTDYRADSLMKDAAEERLGEE